MDLLCPALYHKYSSVTLWLISMMPDILHEQLARETEKEKKAIASLIGVRSEIVGGVSGVVLH